jgi:hypothetical protein
LILISAEKTRALEASILENKLPSTDSTINHVNTIVRVPKRAGKKRIQNTVPPRRYMILEINAVKGGTEMYPNAR